MYFPPGGNASAGNTLYIASADWCDSCDTGALTIGGVSMARPSVGARLRLQVGAGCRQLTIAAGSTVYQAGYPTFSDIGVAIDGVWTSTIQVRENDLMRLYHLALDGAAHVVELISGYQQANTSIADIKATCVHAVSSQGGSVALLAEPSTSRRLVIYGNSVGTGSLADPITQYGWPFVLRGTYPGRITQWTHGGWQISNDSVGDTDYTAWAARLIGAMGSATTREVWMEIGYNDTAEYIATLYPVALRALLAADPAVRIYAQTMFRTTADNSDKRAAIAAAVESVASSRVVLVDGLTLMNDASGLAADGLHLNNTGSATVAANADAVLRAA